ncbi:hypothetical protein ACFV4F_19660 [Kitasatospora sp. NPDC059722]|uniref:hypothetical protein n=1 Tax=unclassified Kitasatospora TaxID=2633591 RepID=UPI00365F8D8F
MDESQDGPQVGWEPVRFRVPCPNCSGGVRTRARLGVRADRTGTGYITETCGDCLGRGWLPFGG